MMRTRVKTRMRTRVWTVAGMVMALVLAGMLAVMMTVSAVPAWAADEAGSSPSPSPSPGPAPTEDAAPLDGSVENNDSSDGNAGKSGSSFATLPKFIRGDRHKHEKSDNNGNLRDHASDDYARRGNENNEDTSGDKNDGMVIDPPDTRMVTIADAGLKEWLAVLFAVLGLASIITLQYYHYRRSRGEDARDDAQDDEQERDDSIVSTEDADDKPTIDPGERE